MKTDPQELPVQLELLDLRVQRGPQALRDLRVLLVQQVRQDLQE